MKSTSHTTNRFPIPLLLRILRVLFFTLLLAPLFPMDFLIAAPVFGQALYIQLLIALMGIVYCLLVFFEPSYAQRYTPLLWAVLIFIFFLILSTAFSIHPALSFWGEAYNMRGLLSFFYLGFVFIILSNVFTSLEDWRLYLRELLAIASVMVFYNVVFVAKGDFTAFFSQEFGSTMFNVGHLASFLLIVFFLGFLLAREESSRAWRRIVYVVLSIVALGLVLTLNRGAFLGFFAGFAILFFGSDMSRRRKLVISLSGILIVSGLFFSGYLYRSSIESLFPRVSKLATYNVEQGSISVRLLGWSLALSGFLDRPVTGWGLHSFDTVADTNFKPNTSVYIDADKWFSHAHNVPLNHLAEIGLFGVLSYLSLFVVSFVMIWSRASTLRPYLKFGFTALLVAYFVQNLFLFDHPAGLLLFFTTLALISGLCSKKRTGRFSLAVTRTFAVIFVLILMFGLYGIFQSVYGGWLGARCIRQHNEYRDLQPCDAAVRYAEFLLPTLVQSIGEAADAQINASEYFPVAFKDFLKLGLRFSDTVIEKIPASLPVSSRHLWNRARFAYILYLSQEGDSYLELSANDLRAIIAHSPYRLETYAMLSDVLSLQNRNAEAIRVLETARSFGIAYGPINFALGLAYGRAGDFLPAVREIEQSLELGHTPWHTKPGLAESVRTIYLRARDLERNATDSQ